MYLDNMSETSSINYLITLKSHFEQELAEADAKVDSLREQLAHVDALLLNQLVPAHSVAPLQAHVETPTPELLLSAQVDTPTVRIDWAPAQNEPEATAPTSIPPETKAAPKPTAAKSKRSAPRSMLPAYQELTRLEAIATVLLAHQGQAVTADTLAQELFGTLSTVDHKAEAKRLNTLLNQGVKGKLWQKGRKPSSYLIQGEKSKRKKQDNQKVSSATPKTTAAKVETDAVKPSAKAATKPRANAKESKTKPGVTGAQPRVSLCLLPPYEGKPKQDAIAAVLEQQGGKAMHRDRIIRTLYGDLSTENLTVERKRMTTALHRGVKTKKWKKATTPLSYQIVPPAKVAKSKGTGRKSKAAKIQPDLVVDAVAESTPASTKKPVTTAKPKRGRKPVTSKAKTHAKTKAKVTRKKTAQTKARAEG